MSREKIMNVFEAIETNFATRDLRPEIIDDQELNKILEAARLTQSAKNIQPWYFMIIKKKETMLDLAKLMAGDIDETIMKKAPMALAIIGDPASEFWLYDLGRVTQSMTLAAWELGIGSCVISGPEPPDREGYRTKAGKLLGVPDRLKLQELMIFGYPEKKMKNKHKDRKKLEDIILRRLV